MISPHKEIKLIILKCKNSSLFLRLIRISNIHKKSIFFCLLPREKIIPMVFFFIHIYALLLLLKCSSEGYLTLRCKDLYLSS